VALGAAALGLAGLSQANGYLTRQTDRSLLACAGSLLRRGVVAPPGSGPVSGQVPPGACGMELLSASRQVLTFTAPGPVTPAGGSWPVTHVTRPGTVLGAGASGRWRVVVESVRYQPWRIPYVYGPDDMKYVISGRPGPGSHGMLVVIAGLAAAGRITGRFAAGYAAVAGIVLVLLAAAAYALTRVMVRPLRHAAEYAEHAGHAAAAEQLHAGRTAETATRQAADQVSAHLAETAGRLLRSANVVRGSAQYYRQRGTVPAADLDRMLRRMAGEAAQMEALIDGLDARPPP